MPDNASRTLSLIVAAAMSTGTPGFGQDADDPQPIRFNFKDASFEDVLDFMARQTGLPVIREADLPKVPVSFISASEYDLPEALDVLNRMLWMHGVQVRREAQFLLLSKVEDMPALSPVLQDRVGEGTGDAQIVTIVVPLNNASAPPTAEQLKPLISKFGAVNALPAQNLLVLVDTAAQCRRLRSIIEIMDAEPPSDSKFRLFPIEHAKADTVVKSLTGLVAEKRSMVIIDKDGKMKTVEEEDIKGLSLEPDMRTNSIIAVGPDARLEQVEQLIALLDRPERGQGGTEMLTISLINLSPSQAARDLGALFKAVPNNRKPTIIPIQQHGKLTVVGSATQLMQSSALLSELDPGSGPSGGLSTADPAHAGATAAIVTLEHITPEQAQRMVSRLMSPRQTSVLKHVPTPDSAGIVVTGPSRDIDAFRELIGAIDVAPKRRTEVRQIRVTSAEPDSALDRAGELYDLERPDGNDPVTVSFDAETRTATLVGSRDGLAAFQRLLESVEATAVVDRETRSYELELVRPSELAARLNRIARTMLDPDDGAAFAAPVLEALDELQTLQVRAHPDQFAVIERLIETLDRSDPAARAFRVLRIRNADVQAVADRALSLFESQSEGMTPAQAGTVDVEVDRTSGNLLITADRIGMSRFTPLITQAQQLVPAERTTRLIDLRQADAADVIEPLRALMATTQSIDPGRDVLPPKLAVVSETNSLLVTAESAQHELVRQYASRLDRIEPGDLPPLKILQLRTADAPSIARLLAEQYAKRSPAERAERPVEIKADAPTNTLIVAAHADLFVDIKTFIEELNKQRDDEPDRVTELFPLRVARAADVAQAMDKLYPEPPMPRDSRGRPMPWLQKPREVLVSADPASNSLIIEAPAERMDAFKALAEKLDRVELPPVADLRTYRIVKADLNAIATTLRSLAGRGNLTAPSEPGTPSVNVVIEVEPRSSTLIVAGDDTTFARVEEILEDLSAVPIERQLRVIPLTNMRAEEVRTKATAIYAAQVADLRDPGTVEVTADNESNTLNVIADGESMTRFMAIVTELQRQAGPAREVRLIELRYAPADEVAAFLSDLHTSSRPLTSSGGADPVWEPIEATNSLLVAAQPSQFPVIESLVRSLDSRRTADRPPLRILKLRTTDAMSLSQVLSRTYNQRSSEQRATLPVEISADGATNTLIVSAHPDIFPEIESIVRDLNETQGIDAEGREIRIFPLKVARAEALARTIDQMYPEPPTPRDSRGRPRPDLARSREIVVRADAATNSLIVDAPVQRLAGFEQLVQQLDQQQVPDDVEVRTYRIQRAELGAVASTLRELVANKAFATDGAANAQALISITTEPVSRTLVVSGPTEIFDRVDAVLSDLDAAPDRPATGMKMYALAHTRAERIQPLLDRLLSMRLRDQAERDGRNATDDLESLLDVAADGPTNTLIISAPEAIQQLAGEIIVSLDTEDAQLGRSVIRVVPMTYADAANVAQTVNQAMPTMELPSGGRVSVIATSGSNALLLSGAQDDLERVSELIQSLDVRPFDEAALDVRTFKLEHADATKIVGLVERLLVDQQQTDPRLLQLRYRYQRNALPQPARARVDADERTNSLVVSGPVTTIGLAEQIIQRLDRPADETGREAATYTPVKSDPARLARSAGPVISASVTQSPRPVQVSPDPTSGVVVVVGSAAQVGETLAILADFDDRAVTLPEVEVRAFDLKHSDATATLAPLRAFLTDRSRWPAPLRAAEQAGLAMPTPSVNADPTQNRLLVSAPVTLMPLAVELLDVLDQPGSIRSVDVRVFTLDRGNAASVADALRTGLSSGLTAGEKPPTVTAEPESNTIVVSAHPERLALAGDLLESLDVSARPDGMSVRTVFLEHASAETVAPLVEGLLEKDSMMADIPVWERAWLRRSGIQEAEQIRVAAERRLNAVVLTGPAASVEMAEQIIKQLDTDSSTPAADTRVLRILTLDNADAASTGETVEAMFDGATGDAPPVVRVDTGSNSLIVRATMRQLGEIETFVETLDRATMISSREIRTIPIDPSRADAQRMAEAVRRLLEQRGTTGVEIISAEDLFAPETEDRRGSDARPVRPSGLLDARILLLATQFALQPEAAPGTTEDAPERSVTIAVDPETNSLVVVGSPRSAERVAALVAELEQQMPAEIGRLRVIELPAGTEARAVQSVVSSTLRQVGVRSAQNPGGTTSRPSVRADPAGDALIVIANDTDFELVKELIRAVVRPRTGIETTVKLYPLTNVDARNAARSINDLISGVPRGRQAKRVMELSLETPDGATATIVPGTVRVTADPSGASLIVAAPPEAVPLIDRFIGLLDQAPVVNQLQIQRLELSNARATDVARTLQNSFDAQRQGRGARSTPRARFVPDARSNSILVTATGEQAAQAQRLLSELDAPQIDANLETALIQLKVAAPSAVGDIVRSVLTGGDPGKEQDLRIVAKDNASVIVVTAPPADVARAREIIAEIDAADMSGLPVRSIKLERADAQEVATALQRFFRDRSRATGRAGRRGASTVAVVGDKETQTLIVSASDDDYQQVLSLVETFDAAAPARELKFTVIPLENADVTELEETIEDFVDELRYGSFWYGGGSDDDPDKLMVEFDQRTNSVVLLGQGEGFDTIERVISELDLPSGESADLVVEAVKLDAADPFVVSRTIERATATPNWRFWRGRDPGMVDVEVDRRSGTVVLLGRRDRVEEALEYVGQLDIAASGEGEQQIETIALKFADASRIAGSISRFFRDKARRAGSGDSTVSVIGSSEGNVLIVSATGDDLTLVRELASQMDQPNEGDDRQRELYTLRNADASELANTLREQFPRQRGAADGSVIVTPLPSANSMIVSAPQELFDRVDALIAQLDAPPSQESSTIATLSLSTARADEVAASLRQALPSTVKVTITPLSRTNSLMLTGSDEAIALVTEQINKLDSQPQRSPVEFRRIPLEHAIAIDVQSTIRTLLRDLPRDGDDPRPAISYARGDNAVLLQGTSAQLDTIEEMIARLDEPGSESRQIEFVQLRFSDAEQTAQALQVFYGPFASIPTTPEAERVAIIAVPVSNSLLISADQTEWGRITELLNELDSEEYDTSRQLEIIALEHADASSLARSLTEAFQAPLRAELERERIRARDRQNRRRGDDEVFDAPAVLIDSDETVTVTAETLTNALIVSAGKEDLARIRSVVERVDVRGFSDLPTPKIIPIGVGRPTQIAATLREMYREQGGRTSGPRAIAIIGDDTSRTLIVRADPAEFAQISALADTLQQAGDRTRIAVRVLRLDRVPAARLAPTVLTTFRPAANQRSEPLAVQVDRASNTLVISSTAEMFAEIQSVARELDQSAPGMADDGNGAMPSPGVYIIDLKHTVPEQMRQTLIRMGVTRPQPAERPGVVAEPVTILTLNSRRALGLVANPSDGDTISRLVRSLDTEPLGTDQQVAMLPMKIASASAVVNSLKQMIAAGRAEASTPLAAALAEQVRRLTIRSDAADRAPIALDLTQPVRLFADGDTNAVVIASNDANVLALSELALLLDRLPAGDAVILRFFPLEHASAERLAGVVSDLFEQGERIRRRPGTQRSGEPTTEVGRALMGEVAVSIDQRTNALIVAGREEAVALVEVMVGELDSDQTANWIEPVVIEVEHANVASLAQTLRDVLVNGLAPTPEAQALQRQVARIRLAQEGGDTRTPSIATDLFAPLSSLVIVPEEQINAILVVGSSSNVDAVRTLVGMLDIPAASAENSVRIYPLRFAAADRVAGMLREIFEQQVRVGAIRPEDDLVLVPDTRTNSLVISTSPSSFQIAEALVRQLDGAQTDPLVGLHVLRVEGADVQSLAPKIRTLMRDRIRSARTGALTPSDAFSIEADRASGTLIVASSNENLRVVEELVDVLSQGGTDGAVGDVVDIVATDGVRADQMVDAINELYVEGELTRRGPDAVRVTPDPRLKGLIVRGTQADVDAIRALVDKLAEAPASTVTEIKRIELTKANAGDVLRLLEDVIAGRPLARGGAIGERQARILRFMRQAAGDSGDDPTEAEISGTIREQVTLTAELRTNSIVVVAPTPLMELIEEIVADVDTTKAGGRQIEIFSLANADARAMAEVLRDLFNLRQQGNTLVLVPGRGQSLTEDGAATTEPDTQLFPIPDERQQLSITIDARTNSLLVSATDEYLSEVRKVVSKLDEIEANERDQIVYELRNARASDVAATLREYFSGESDTFREILGPDRSGSLIRLLEREVTVQGDESSQRLIVGVSPKYRETIDSIVEELDSTPPQVMIQVLLAEVTLDESTDWGLDFRGGPAGSRGVLGQFLTAGVGAATALGVPNLSVTSLDFELLVRALEDQGLLEVLSRPQILVNNNEPARIQVGQNIAIIEGVERLDNGNTRSDVSRRDVGIIMDVTPSINTDGFVRMVIEPEISTVSSQTTQISEDFVSPIINTREIQTNVTVKDGETIVIGGLIQTTKTERDTKVPFFGDVPLIGELFKSYETSNVKTELLVILTPRVIRSGSDDGVGELRALSRDEINLLSVPDSVKRQLRTNSINTPLDLTGSDTTTAETNNVPEPPPGLIGDDNGF